MRSSKSVRVVAVLAAAFVTKAALADVVFEPASQTVPVGAAVAVDIIVSNVSVGGFDLDVEFDPAVLFLENVTFDTFLGGDLFSLQSSSVNAGTVDVAEVSLLSSSELLVLQPAAFRLATLSFTALAAGISPLTFLQLDFSDPDANLFTLSGTAGSITVTAPAPVPEPAGLILLATIAALMLRRR